ncbi:MAG: YgjP-like metallopeptidase domain-containing protein, partial [Sphingomonas sp.]
MRASAPDDLAAALDIVRHPRARRLRLSMDPASGRVRLTLPPRVSLAEGLRWADGHRGWMAAQQQRLPTARPFVAGAAVPFDDTTLVIDWRPQAARRAVREGNLLVVGGPAEGLAGRVQRWLKAQALEILLAETAHYAALA